MASRLKSLNDARMILMSRSFSERQIENVLPKLQHEFIEQPSFLGEIIDTWNQLLSTNKLPSHEANIVPRVAVPPESSRVMKGVDMTTILADIEPDLLRIEPKKLVKRHQKILNLGVVFNLSEVWTILYNAPRGFYLQDWSDLQTKLLYISSNVLDLLFDKKELQRHPNHPVVRSAAVVETDLDHIRARYLFAQRCGYKSLSHMYPVQISLHRPDIGDLILTDDKTYLRKFAPFCSLEEYNMFSDLIKKHDFDEDDTEVYEKLAELDELRHN